MIFSDPRYVVFLAGVAGLFFLLPAGRARQAWLLFASYAFYAGFHPAYLLLLLAVTTVAYVGGLVLERAPTGRRRRVLFVVFLLLALSLLFVFKYFDFVSSLLARALALAGSPREPLLLRVILPIGISFYTFQAVGYLIDVYVGKIRAERRPLRFFLFIAFFSQLVAGPIERAGHILPQLDLDKNFDYGRVVAGLRLILCGLVLKIIFADRLAPIVDAVYASPRAHGGVDLLVATACFSFQAYADFSGYSLIAIGSAAVLGVELMTNFKQPLLSTTIPEFWRTWHISLSQWFRDYVFTPLHLKNRDRGAVGIALALLVTFLATGLWHGAGLRYACFGVLHAVWVGLSTLTFNRRDRFWRNAGVPSPLLTVGRTITTFGLVTLSFVLFRADSLSDAIWIYDQVLHLEGVRTVGMRAPGLIVAAIVLFDVATRFGPSFAEWPAPTRWLAYHAAFASVLAAIAMKIAQGADVARQFIYFKF